NCFQTVVTLLISCTIDFSLHFLLLLSLSTASEYFNFSFSSLSFIILRSAMAREIFDPHLGPVTTSKDLDDIYDLYGVEFKVKTSLPRDKEIPKNVRHVYCRAYICSLTFPLVKPILEILAQLGMTFIQM